MVLPDPEDNPLTPTPRLALGSAPNLTLKRLSIFTLAALALAASAFPSRNQPPAALDFSSLYHPAEAVGQDNGTLTSNLFLATYDTPSPIPRLRDRHASALIPLAPEPLVRRNYPPPAP
jgi:hypothetical protein